MPSWYKNTRAGFLAESANEIVGRLNGAASDDGWEIERDQQIEWFRTITDMHSTLRGDGMGFITGVLAEYDFRRRGLRIDFVLIANGALFVVECKRGKLSSADRDQVMNYCVNLVEFHGLSKSDRLRLFPILVSEHAISR